MLDVACPEFQGISTFPRILCPVIDEHNLPLLLLWDVIEDPISHDGSDAEVA